MYTHSNNSNNSNNSYSSYNSYNIVTPFRRTTTAAKREAAATRVVG